MAKKIIDSSVIQAQTDALKNLLDAKYWEADAANNVAVAKPQFSNVPSQIFISGANVESMQFQRNAVTISAAENNVTISGNNYDEAFAEIFVDSNLDIGVCNEVANVSIAAQKVTLQSGAADCTIYGGNALTVFNDEIQGGNLYQINGNEGDKIITGFTPFDSLQITDDSTFTAETLNVDNTNYITVNIGNSNISLQGSLTEIDRLNILDKDGVLISGYGVNNSVVFKSPDITITQQLAKTTVTGNNCSVTGSAVSDSIWTSGNNVTVLPANGADYVFNTGNGSYINGGAGIDTIISYGDNCSINTGGANDFIEVYGGNNTINACYVGTNATINNYNTSDKGNFYWTIFNGANGYITIYNIDNEKDSVIIYKPGDGVVSSCVVDAQKTLMTVTMKLRNLYTAVYYLHTKKPINSWVDLNLCSVASATAAPTRIYPAITFQ